MGDETTFDAEHTYKSWWPLYEEMPEGWRLDKAGSPLHGYSFITDGKSIINGGKRALLRVARPQKDKPDCPHVSQNRPVVQSPCNQKAPAKNDFSRFAPSHAKTVNDLARAKFKEKLLNDILVDLTICEIEGWDKMEYINELKELISSFAKSATIPQEIIK